VYTLPLEEPVIVKPGVYLVSIIKGAGEDGDGYLIHRYIVQERFEYLKKNNATNTIRYD